MPKKKEVKPKIEWPPLKMLFATGMSYKDIQARTGIPLGTLTSQGSRDNWEAARKMVQGVADRQLATAQMAIASKTERGQNWERRIETQAEKVVAVLETQSPTDIKSAGQFVDVLDKADKVGRRSLGMESEGEGSKVIVNLGVLQESSPIRAEIIDIPSENCQKLDDSPS